MSVDAFPFSWPSPGLANRLANDAIAHVARGQTKEALLLIERAIRLDQVGGLNRYCSLRVSIADSLNISNPRSAHNLYNSAIQLKQLGEFTEAKVAYLEAFALDPLFLWPANNYAWSLATSTDASHRNGTKAVVFAKTVCEQSNWNCWAFIDTLAASYAEAGVFTYAIGWQGVAVKLAPLQRKPEALIRRDLYRRGRSYTDRDSVTSRINVRNADSTAWKSASTTRSCATPVVDLNPIIQHVVFLCRHKSILQVEELWSAIELACVEQTGFQPNPAVRLIIELSVIAQRADLWRSVRGAHGDWYVSRLSWSGCGSPHNVREDTSPWQDNAIRALEGD